MSAVVGVVLMQAGWFACVLGATHGHPLFGPPIAIALLAWHVREQPNRSREGLFLLGSAIVGFVVDTLLLHFAATAIGDARVSPLWLVVLWPNFTATTSPNGTLRALAARPLIGLPFGAICGPLAYVGGSHLGAIRICDPELRSLVLIGVGWALAVPLLLMMRARATRRPREAVDSNVDAGA